MKGGTPITVMRVESINIRDTAKKTSYLKPGLSPTGSEPSACPEQTLLLLFFFFFIQEPYAIFSCVICSPTARRDSMIGQ